MAGDPRSVMVFAAPADPQRREQLDALALCDLYRVSPGSFTVVLIGRHGAELERWEEPVETAELWRLIDDLDGG